MTDKQPRRKKQPPSQELSETAQSEVDTPLSSMTDEEIRTLSAEELDLIGLAISRIVNGKWSELKSQGKLPSMTDLYYKLYELRKRHGRSDLRFEVRTEKEEK